MDNQDYNPNPEQSPIIEETVLRYLDIMTAYATVGNPEKVKALSEELINQLKQDQRKVGQALRAIRDMAPKTEGPTPELSGRLKTMARGLSTKFEIASTTLNDFKRDATIIYHLAELNAAA